MYSPEKQAERKDPGEDHHWHVLYTRHQHEKAVARVLTSKGHDMFLPLVYAAHRWQDRTKRLWLPLFPCYVFIKGGFDRHVQILSTPGMISVVTCSGRPAVIPTGEIDTVRQMIESTDRVESHPFLECGDRMRVIAGPLRGIEGFLIRKKNMFRLIVGVALLAQSAAVEIDISCVEAIASSPVSAATQLRRAYTSS